MTTLFFSVTALAAALLLGLGLARLFESFERAARLDALRHYRSSRRHIRTMKRIRTPRRPWIYTAIDQAA